MISNLQGDGDTILLIVKKSIGASAREAGGWMNPHASLSLSSSANSESDKA